MFFRFLLFRLCVMFFCFLLFARGIGRMLLLQQQRCWKDFTIYLITDTWFGGLHTTTSSPTMSMKNMETLEEPHLSALLATATYLPLTIGMTEPTLPSIHVCPRRAVRCRAGYRQAGRQTGRIYPIRVPRWTFLRHGLFNSSTLQYSLFR